MSGVSFNPNEQPTTDVAATVEPVTAPAPAAATPAASPAVPASGAIAPVPKNDLMGDYIPDFKDIFFPRLNIAQNIGDLKDSFAPGTIVLNQETTLFVPQAFNEKTKAVTREATAPLQIVVVGFRKTRFVEKTVGGVRGMIVDTEEAVLANSGTTNYKEWELKKAAGMKLFQPLADALVAIQRPDICADDDTVFVYEVEGAKYTLAMWGMKGTAYTAAKKYFFTPRRMGCLRDGYYTRRFSLTTREDQYGGGNRAWVPVAVVGDKTTPAFLDFVRSALAPPAA